jgi:hypothetical protein
VVALYRELLFAPDAARELEVNGDEADPLGMDGADVGVLEEADEVAPGSSLQALQCPFPDERSCGECSGNLACKPPEGCPGLSPSTALYILIDVGGE